MPVKGFSVFTHPTTAKLNLFSPVWDPFSILGPQFSVYILRSPLFEPVGTCMILHLSFKTSFHIAITLARRVEELGALMADLTIHSILN